MLRFSCRRSSCHADAHPGLGRNRESLPPEASQADDTLLLRVCATRYRGRATSAWHFAPLARSPPSRPDQSPGAWRWYERKASELSARWVPLGRVHRSSWTLPATRPSIRSTSRSRDPWRTSLMTSCQYCRATSRGRGHTKPTEAPL
jgi:hypothetical protein